MKLEDAYGAVAEDFRKELLELVDLLCEKLDTKEQVFVITPVLTQLHEVLYAAEKRDFH